MTGDGLADVVMTTHYANDPARDYRLWVFAQQSDGTLASPSSYPTAATYGNGAKSVAIGDITGDARPDVVVGLAGLGIQVFPQLSTGVLGTPTLTPTPDSLVLRLGRLNADSRLDVATLGWGTNTVSVLMNNGVGGLAAPISYAAQHAGYDDLEIADVSGDGRDDLIVMSGQAYAVPNISVLAQNATGGFSAPAEYRVGTNLTTQGIGVGDVTGDGRKDVVASYGGNSPGARIAVFAQTPTGLLGAPVAFPSYDIPEPVEVVDVDSDGSADVVTAHGGWLRVGVYRQVGGGLQAEQLFSVPYASHYNPHGLAVGDVNGDQAPDVVLADYNNGLVVLYGVSPPRASADLSVSVTPSASAVRPKKSFWFDTTVANAGPNSSAASMVVQLAGSPSKLAVTTPGCSLSGTTVRCTFAGIAAGASTVVRISGIAPQKGSITASASVDAVENDPVAANDAASAAIVVR